MAYKVLLPLKNMALRAETITANQLDQRLPVENPNDELGYMARVLNDLLARLQDSFDNLKRFTADASHELRTPLASIRSVGEVGLQRLHTADEYRDTIGSMLEEVTRLTEMVDGLLSISRADAGQVTLHRTTFSPLDLAREVVGILGLLAEEKGQHIQIEGNAQSASKRRSHGVAAWAGKYRGERHQIFSTVDHDLHPCLTLGNRGHCCRRQRGNYPRGA
jgi:signal transduction histidine kinase